MKFRGDTSGFALPTVVISSLILMIVLVAGLSVATSTSTSLQQQYYDQLTREAAEAGVTFAQACLDANNSTVTWTNAKPLRPGTNCSGTMVCGSNCYVYSDSKITMTFQVNLPTQTADGFQIVQATGSVSQLRASNGAAWNTITQSINAKVGGSISAQSIVYGYTQFNTPGGFYGIIGGDGIFRTAGLNSYGQLGQGVAAGATVTTPASFLTPGSTTAIVKGFANNLSTGDALFAVTSDGKAYAAGRNDHGQLGIGAISGNITTPAQVQISGKSIRTIATAGYTGSNSGSSYFVTTDNYLYASGACANYMLGYTCSADQWTPQLVGLPTPNAGDLNTLPSDNIVVDRFNVYVRMQGGAVYGWGSGDYGQLGGASRSPSTNPVRLGTYGNTGQPKATSIAFDGSTLYVLDDSGKLNSIGRNLNGQMGNRSMMLYMASSNGKCITNNGTAPALQACTGAANQQMKFEASGTITNNYLCMGINADNTWMNFSSCTGAANQQWTMDTTALNLINPALGKCIDNYYSDGVSLWMSTCGGGNYNQIFEGYNPSFTSFNMTGINGGISMISADQRSVSVLTTAGEVWSAGYDDMGMFGDNVASGFHPDPGQFNMTAYGSPRLTYVYNTESSISGNVYAIATDGRVYGSGKNNFGQLGNCTTSTLSGLPVQMKLLVPLSTSYTPCTVNSYAFEDLNPVQVISGGGTTVIRMGTNRIFSVGNNSSGQLGDGTTTTSSEPKARKFLNIAAPLSY